MSREISKLCKRNVIIDEPLKHCGFLMACFDLISNFLFIFCHLRNRPCMELVLWRPPCEPLSDKLAALTEQRKSKHREPQCDPDLYNKNTKLDSSLMCGDMNQTSAVEEDMEL